jgi:hypothetical protein
VRLRIASRRTEVPTRLQTLARRARNCGGIVTADSERLRRPWELRCALLFVCKIVEEPVAGLKHGDAFEFGVSDVELALADITVAERLGFWRVKAGGFSEKDCGEHLHDLFYDGPTNSSLCKG